MPEKMLSAEQEKLVENLLAQLTLREKISLLSGRDTWSTMPIERELDGAKGGIPALVMTDGPHGVRTNQPDASRAVCDTTTAFPTGVSMASTWDTELIEAVGRALGEETLATGCDILLGPCVNIVRTPIAGRNFEAYAEDPYLAGRIGVAYVKGVQSSGAGTSLKHYAANNQEIERYRGSSEVDERTLREIYLPHFEMVVKEAQPWTVMCSYNRINGVYASQNDYLLNEILRGEWGFEGIVVSDWTANHTTTESVKGGLDLEMPGPARWYGDLLAEAVRVWQVEEETIDTAARRILRMIVRSGKLDGKQAKASYNTPAHQTLARRVAEEAIVLLKNKGGILPLDPAQMHTLAIIGPAAENIAVSGGGSAEVEPPYRVTPLAALRKELGDKIEVRYEQGADNWTDLPVLSPAFVTPTSGGKVVTGKGGGLYGEYFAGQGFDGPALMQRVDPRLRYHWFSAGPAAGIGSSFSARWTGRLEVPAASRYTFQIRNTGTARLYLDGKLILESTGSKDPPDPGFHAEVLCDLEQGRPYDLRLELTSPPDQPGTGISLAFGATPAVDDRLERAVALAKEAEVVVVFVGDTDSWETEGTDRPHLRLPAGQDELVSAVAAANPNTVVVLNCGAPVEMPWLEQVAGLVQMYYPGLEGGAAVMEVLTGKVNPSGKLTVTYPRRFEDTPSFTNLSIHEARQVRYGEGIFTGYRYYDTAKVAPLFPFGYGLSYTSFAYAALRAPARVKPGESFSASVEVTNTGKRAGKEVVQLYVRDAACSVPRPVKELKGFAKLDLQPGETKTATFTLDPRALSFYDPLKKTWVAEEGEFEILVGASAADIRARAKVVLEK